MNNQTRKQHAQTGLEMLTEAVFEVLSPKEGMKQADIIEELGLCLSAGAGNSGEVIYGICCLLREKKLVKNEGKEWYRCG